MGEFGGERKKSVLLIAADADLRAALTEAFSNEPGITFSHAPACGDALAQAGGPDILLLADETASALPGARAAGFSGAAIRLTRGDPIEDGAFDATLRLPLRFSRLLAAVEALAAATCPLLSTRSAEGALLTETESALLARLARAKGGVVPREVLLREVWGYSSSVSTHTLETHIHRLRRKIESARGRPKLLLTAPGGYRLAEKGHAGRIDTRT